MCLQGKFPANIVAQNQIEVRLKGPSQQQSRESISEMFLSDIGILVAVDTTFFGSMSHWGYEPSFFSEPFLLVSLNRIEVKLNIVEFG